MHAGDPVDFVLMALKRVVAIDCGAAHVAAGWFTDGKEK
jgi:hypothetical protein